MRSPILFIVFNRPETTRQVFEVIAQARPSKLYVAADGPRRAKPGEKELCELTRKIATSIDWPCQVITRFQEGNLGCKYGVSSAIDWFFENEEEGIILEDDVVPNQDFFIFCNQMLDNYRADTRVMMITGTNYLSDSKAASPYFFSEHFSIWGWATWRRAWNQYDVSMAGWEKLENQKNIAYKFQKSYIWKYFQVIFNSLKTTYIDTWDIQWVYTCITNNGLCITPKVNLISNIGVEGSHSNSITSSHFMETYSLEGINFNAKIPVIADANYDERLHELKTKPALNRIKIIKILKIMRLDQVTKKLIKYLNITF